MKLINKNNKSIYRVFSIYWIAHSVLMFYTPGFGETPVQDTNLRGSPDTQRVQVRGLEGQERVHRGHEADI